MRLWKRGLLTGGGAAACVACCAAPLLFGSTLAGPAGLGGVGVGFAKWGEKGLIVALAISGGAWLLWRRFERARQARSNAGCDRRPSAGCDAGGSCVVPAAFGPTPAK